MTNHKPARNFGDLTRPIEADPARAERLAVEIEAAVTEHVAYSLNEIRRELGISQSDLAEILQVSQPAVSQALNRTSTIEKMRRIVEAMGGELEVAVRVGDRRFPVDA